MGIADMFCTPPATTRSPDGGSGCLRRCYVGLLRAGRNLLRTFTSFANGGQISVSHAEPWANPSAPLKVMKWLAREDAPLLFRLRPDLDQWLWGLQFLRECLPARTRHNIAQIVNLGLYSRETLRELANPGRAPLTAAVPGSW